MGSWLDYRDASAIAVAVTAVLLTAAAWTFDGAQPAGGFDTWLSRLTGPGTQVAETER